MIENIKITESRSRYELKDNYSYKLKANKGFLEILIYYYDDLIYDEILNDEILNDDLPRFGEDSIFVNEIINRHKRERKIKELLDER